MFDLDAKKSNPDDPHYDPHYNEYTNGGAAYIGGKLREHVLELFKDPESPEAEAWLKGYDETKKGKEEKAGGKLKD